MTWLARHWQVSVVLVALLVVGVAFAVASDIGSLPASEQSDATTTAIVGAVIGALAAIVVFGGSSWLLPRTLTRNPEKQAANAKLALPVGIAGAVVLGGAIKALGSHAQIGIMSAIAGWFVVVIVWRTWFETSDTARRRWPAHD